MRNVIEMKSYHIITAAVSGVFLHFFILHFVAEKKNIFEMILCVSILVAGVAIVARNERSAENHSRKLTLDSSQPATRSVEVMAI